LFFSIYVFFFVLAIGQNLSSPVKKLLDKATELSKGNLSSRVYIESKDELSELAAIFNKIAEELQQSSTQEDVLQKSVDMKVRAKTQELQEIITALEQKVKNRTVELDKIITELERLKLETKFNELNSLKQKIDKPKKPKKNAGIA